MHGTDKRKSVVTSKTCSNILHGAWCWKLPIVLWFISFIRTHDINAATRTAPPDPTSWMSRGRDIQDGPNYVYWVVYITPKKLLNESWIRLCVPSPLLCTSNNSLVIILPVNLVPLHGSSACVCFPWCDAHKWSSKLRCFTHDMSHYKKNLPEQIILFIQQIQWKVRYNTKQHTGVSLK